MGTVEYKTETDLNGYRSVREYHTIVVHRFKVGDVDEPDIYAASGLWEWQNSPQGEFIIANAVETPTWYKQAGTEFYGYSYAITAKLEKSKLVEYYLKWGNPNERI